MANDLKPGDVVRLKSGGPSITITGRDAAIAGKVIVAWFDGRELRTASIGADALEMSEKDKPFMAFVG